MGEKMPRLWLADDPGKRWTEVFFLAYSPFWMAWALCILVPFKLYDHLGQLGYLLVGLAAATPCVVLPLLLQQPPSELQRPLIQRYWVRANAWIAVFSFVGNYFWTHYFYSLLGAEYTFRSWRLNNVPITLYIMTHAYFCFYHTLANVCLRRVGRACSSCPSLRMATQAAVVFALAYATAFMETLTIAHFPHYRFQDKDRMYTIGSLFYAIYFFVSFPMFYRMDESPKQRWTLQQAVLDSLAASMLVTCLLDFWRLSLGAIWSQTVGGVESGGGQRLPWLPSEQTK